MARGTFPCTCVILHSAPRALPSFLQASHRHSKRATTTGRGLAGGEDTRSHMLGSLQNDRRKERQLPFVTCQSETSRSRNYLGPTTSHLIRACKSLASVQSAVLLPRGSQGFLSSVRLHGRKAVGPVYFTAQYLTHAFLYCYLASCDLLNKDGSN